MTEKKSIVEQALLQVTALEEAVKRNAKGILQSTMKEELNTLLKEQAEDEEDIVSPEDEEGLPDETGDEELPSDEELPDDDELSPEDDELSTEDSDELPSDDELPGDFGGSEEGDDDSDEVLDMTGASSDEVARVFRAMSEKDGIIVRKDGNTVELNVEEPGEYIIKLDEQYEGDEITDENIYEIELEDDLDEQSNEFDQSVPAEFTEDKNDPFSSKVGETLTKGRTEKGLSNSNPTGKKPSAGDGNPFTKGQGENLNKNRTEKGLSNSNPSGKKPNAGTGDPFDKTKGEPVTSGNSIRKTVVKGEQTEAARTKSNPHGNKGGADRAGIPSKKVYRAGSGVNLTEEVESLKKQNAEYKKALVIFKEKLNEVAVFNANLAFATRLFTEHTTTKQEKLKILKRFDSISTITESKNLYGQIKTELDNKKPITESVVETIASPVKTSSSTSMLSESTIYQNPQFKRMKDLMGINKK